MNAATRFARSTSRARMFLALTATIFAVAACDGSELSSTYPNGGEGTSGSQDARTPQGFDVVSGSNQSGAAGEVLPQAAVVRVTASGNRPIRNMDVDFVVIGGGGSVSPSRAASDRDGLASTRWTLGPSAGTQTLEARIVHPSKGTILASTRFTATAVDPGSGGGGSATSVSFGSDWFSLNARGQTVLVPVAATGGDGNPVGASALTWTTSNPSVARVDASGLITAWEDGTARIIGSLAGVADTATVVVERQPASVAIVLPSSTVEVGRDVSLSTRLEDANGHPVGTTLAALNWSLSGANAEISAAGVLRPIEPGQLQVSAAYQDLEGSVQLTAVDPAMPGTQIFTDGLESGSLSSWTDGANPQYHTVVRDPALARSGDHVLRVDFPSGGSAGYLTTFFGPGHDAVRVRFWVQLEEGWEGSTTLLGLYGSRTDDLWSAHGQTGVCPDGTNHFSSFLGVGGSGGTRPLSFSTAHMNESAPCTRDSGGGASSFAAGQGLVPGRWHKVEFEVRANTPGLRDGSQSAWVDGELVGQWNGLEFRAGTMLALNSAQLAFAADGAASRGQYLLVDDVEVTSVAGNSGGGGGVTLDRSSVAFDALGAQLQLTAAGSGASATSGTMEWSSGNSAVASVDNHGLVTAVANGSTEITVTYGGASASASVTVQQRVATINVSPSSATLAPGESRWFTASARDANGQTVSTGPLSWASSRGWVATVAQDGSVTALVEGTATISVTADGVTGTSAVTVSTGGGDTGGGDTGDGDPDDGDPGDGGTGGGSGVYPNEPAGFTTFNYQPWDALRSNGWGHTNRTTYSHIRHDATSPGSPGSVIEFVYPEGYTNVGTEPAADYLWLGKSDVYVSFWFKASPGWHGHATGTNKMLFFMNSDGTQDNLFMAMRGGDGGPYSLVMYPQGHTEQSLREDNGIPGWFYANQNDTPVVPGQWHRIEIVLNHLDGELRWWMDGELIAEHTGLALDGQAFGNISIAPTWGGIGGSDKRQNDYLRYDDFYISVGSR